MAINIKPAFMKRLFSLFLLINNCLWLEALSQSVGIGTSTPNSSAVLDLESTSKGLLIPRLTISKRDAIANPAKGLIIYVIEDSGLFIYNGAWRRLVPADEVWNTNGNTGIDTAVNFIGTTDNKPVKFKVNNNLLLQLDSSGRLQFYGPGNNLFVGYGAGINNSTGVQNHFTGYSAGLSNTTGHTNHFNGFETGHFNTTGSENYFSGTFAGYTNSTGSNNHFTGHLAGANNSTGHNNHFSGFTAGFSNISGSNNTLIGHFTDVGNNNLTNAGAIGYHAIVAQSNSFVIGGTGADAVNVGIGTITPATTLDVKSINANSNIATFRSAGGFGQILVTQGAVTTDLGSNGTGGYTGTNSAGDFSIRTGAISRMFFQHSTGRIGIGTDTPSETLHVAGNIAIDGIIPNQEFQAPVFQGTWANFSNGFAAAGYYKDKEGRVHLRGTVWHGGAPVNTAIFTLPVGYRPSNSGRLSFSVNYDSGPGATCVLISPDGLVQVSCIWPGSHLQLDGISFRAD
jgi:hypothetical protein